METGDYFPDPDPESYFSGEDSRPEDGGGTADSLSWSVLQASAQMVIYRGDRIDVVGNGDSSSTTSSAVADLQADECATADADIPEVKSRGKTIKRASVQADLQCGSTATLRKKSRPSSANVQDASTVDLPATSYTDEKPTEKAIAQRKWKRENNDNDTVPHF